jgi:hypothetical protein
MKDEKQAAIELEQWITDASESGLEPMLIRVSKGCFAKNRAKFDNILMANRAISSDFT